MFKNLNTKNILLGVTGGIAAYKAAELTRLLIKNGANVRVVMTKSATQLVQPLTFATLSKHQVYTEMFQQQLETNIEHIELARWADAILIAPATANIIAKINHGIADDLLSTICLATTAPIYIAPAMNKEMWNNIATQNNVNSLLAKGIRFIGPDTGVQACGEIGYGRMLEPENIVQTIETIFIKPLFVAKKIIVTAGPTIEPIDPVRFLSNHSSGKMGYAIAQAAAQHQANVVLISGLTKIPPPSNVKVIAVKTAQQMYDAVMQEIKENGCDIFIAAAAVADYRPENIHNHKIKKNAEKINLTFIPNPDILSAVATLQNRPLTIGFAAETENLIAKAKAKLTAKKLDAIAANLVGENLGFDVEDNSLTVIANNGTILNLEKKPKISLAYELLEFINQLIPSFSERVL